MRPGPSDLSCPLSKETVKDTWTDKKPLADQGPVSLLCDYDSCYYYLITFSQYFMRCALLGQCWQPHLSILRMAGTKECNFLISVPQFVQFPKLFLHSCLSSYRSQDKSLLACLKKNTTPQFLLIHDMLVLKCLVVSNSLGPHGLTYTH